MANDKTKKKKSDGSLPVTGYLRNIFLQDEPATTAAEPEVPQEMRAEGKKKNKKRNMLWGSVKSIVFIILAMLTIIKSFTLLAVSLMSAVAVETFAEEQSGRLVAHVVLSITAAVALSFSSYAVSAVFSKKTKPIHATALVLLVMAALQLIIISASVQPTDHDEKKLHESMVESFRQARFGNAKHMKKWASTQSTLTCCGVYGPEDYRVRSASPVFPPDVPVTCCPNFDSDRSELSQEREREFCRAKRGYYVAGCEREVQNAFNTTGTVTVVVTVVLILLEIAVASLGLVWTRKKKPDQGKSEKEKGDPEK